MSKMLCLLFVLALILALPAIAEETQRAEAPAITGRAMDFYMGDLERAESHNVYFAGDSDVPYLSLSEWADLLNGITKDLILEGKDTAYRVAYSATDGKAFLTREDGYFVSFDWENDVIRFLDYDAFMRPDDSKAIIDTLSVDDPTPDGDAQYFRRATGSYERYGDMLTLKLGEYGIDILNEGSECYVPLQTLSDFFLAIKYVNAFYNGSAVFIAPYGSLEEDNERLSPLGEAFHAVEADRRSESMAAFAYSELCLALDNLYGLKEVHAIDSFDSLAYQTGLKEDLMSTDPQLADVALYQLLHFHLDDLHSGFLNVSPLNKKVAFDDYLDPENMMGQSTLSFEVQEYNYKSVRKAARPDGIPAYEEFGNTAYITFDKFESVPEEANYYETPPAADTEDTIGIMIYAYQQITRENSPIENVVLDLSCNLGGDLDTAIFVIATFLGRASISVKDTMTGALATSIYHVDVNLDGKFDTDDRELINRKLFCLTSPASFSCGNLVPCVFKNSSEVTLLGRASGGGSCAVLPMSTADGTAFQISGPLRMSFTKNGSFYDIDRGAEPDFPLVYPASFYDRESLTEYLNELR